MAVKGFICTSLKIFPSDTGTYSYTTAEPKTCFTQWLLLLFPIWLAEPPEPPADKPLATKTTKDCISLVWPGTTYDGGAPVTGYKVEMCDATGNNWTVCTKNVFSTGFAVKNVKEGKSYKFRVSCINEKGMSKPSAVSDPIAAVEGGK